MKGSGDFLLGGVIDTSFDLVYTFIRPIANQEPLLKIHYRQEWILRSCDSGGMCNSFGYIALHTSLFINTSLIMC